MAQTPDLRLKRLNPDDNYDIRFATALRNQNRHAFFDDRQVGLADSRDWFYRHRWERDFYIIWVDQSRAGTIAVQHLKECEFLQNLCVHPNFRGCGLARWAIIQLMKPNRFIIAQVKPDNKHVIRMYEELGFWRVKR